jgi:hypothetical protein
MTMKIMPIILVFPGLLALGVSSWAQDPEASSGPVEGAAAAVSGTEPGAELVELEAAFRATLTEAVLQGRWCLVEGGTMGPEREESYHISSVTRLGGDLWIITARIRYGRQDITAPVPVRVRWAGDTPVIVVNNVPIPGSGTYSARVMIFGDTYAGSWTGGQRGGLMSGVIRRPELSPSTNDATEPR